MDALSMGNRKGKIQMIKKFNKKGYLKNFHDWNKKIALYIAKKEKICMTDDHWKIIIFFREFYIRFNIIPTVRIIIKCLEKKFGKKIANSAYLFFLFPKGPIQQATKIAGLPFSKRCL